MAISFGIYNYIADSPIPRGNILHTVQIGDTFGHIALKYGESVRDIRTANGLDDYKGLIFSQILLIPKNGEIIYSVKKGDTLYNLAAFYNARTKDIKRWNNIRNDKIIIDEICQAYIQ